MKDRIPANPGRVLVTPENGGSAYYATLTRADNPTQEGTPLNKANLLTDATAALFGLGANAVPNDVFSTVRALIARNATDIANGVKIETGSYVGTGEYNWPTPVPNELTFSIVPKIVFLYSEDYTSYNTIPTHYFFFNGQSSFIPDGTSSGSNALTWSGKTVSWYYNYYVSVSQADGSKFQFNTDGKVYYYTAIG